MSRRRWRWGPGLLLVLMLVLCAACQYVQNEFFFLDCARPEPESEPGVVQPW